MRAAVLLGVRLAVGTRGQRVRSMMIAAAAGVGTLVLLLVWGIAHSQVGDTTAFGANEVRLLLAGTIGMVALPVLVLIATVARLAAGLRDRRLANLRLLGMTAAQTRVVAATEVGVASVLGVVGGVGVFVAAASLLSGIEVAGRAWTYESLVPPPAGWITVLSLVPLVSVLTAALPQRLASDRTPAEEPRQASWWRAVPLAVGLAICWGTRSPLIDRQDTLPGTEVAAIMGGIALTAVGTLLVVPVFVNLVARVVLAGKPGALATLTGRRLQSQPAGATRVISALMVGLFVVMMARAVLVAFTSTSQYEAAADHIERNQTAETVVGPAELSSTTELLRGVEGVDRVVSFPVLSAATRGVSAEDSGVTVVVASCARLAPAGGSLRGCSDDVPSLVGDTWYPRTGVDAMTVQEIHGWEARGDAVPVSLATAGVIDQVAFERAVGAMVNMSVVVVPPGTPGTGPLLEQTDHLVVAHAGPGRDLYDRVDAAGVMTSTSVDIENYDFVRGMRTLIWTLATVVLSVGLLTFAIAGVDRAVNRRRELTALRLIGTPHGVLLKAQWWEAALPTALGSVLAIFVGAYAGATYLQLDEDRLMPMSETVALAGVAVVASMLIALVTVIGTTTRLVPEHIRVE